MKKILDQIYLWSVLLLALSVFGLILASLLINVMWDLFEGIRLYR